MSQIAQQAGPAPYQPPAHPEDPKPGFSPSGTRSRGGTATAPPIPGGPCPARRPPKLSEPAAETSGTPPPFSFFSPFPSSRGRGTELTGGERAEPGGSGGAYHGGGRGRRGARQAPQRGRGRHLKGQARSRRREALAEGQRLMRRPGRGEEERREGRGAARPRLGAAGQPRGGAGLGGGGLAILPPLLTLYTRGEPL